MRFLIDMAVIAALLWVAASIEARAEQPCAWAVATIGSKHINGNPDKNYNEVNTGLGGEHCIGTVFGYEIRGAAGFFRNSNRIDSFYFGGSATLLEHGPVKLGVALLRVSGYDIDPLTALFPVLSVEGRQAGINLSWFPKTGSTASAFGMQAKWKWR